MNYIPPTPPIVATFNPGKPPIFCFIFPKSCQPVKPPKPPVEIEVPGPVPIFGVCAAWGWSRKLRARIEESQK